MSSPVEDASRRIARRMLTEKRITHEMCELALQRMELSGVRFEEALLEAGMSESALLRQLADMYRVQFISTEKLSNARISRKVINLVPEKLARQRNVVPVLFDPKTNVLSVVVMDPEDLETLSNVKIASGAREVKALVARPAAVAAFVELQYDGSRSAFDELAMTKQLNVAFSHDPLDFVHGRPAGEEPSRPQAALDPAQQAAAQQAAAQQAAAQQAQAQALAAQQALAQQAAAQQALAQQLAMQQLAAQQLAAQQLQTGQMPQQPMPTVPPQPVPPGHMPYPAQALDPGSSPGSQPPPAVSHSSLPPPRAGAQTDPIGRRGTQTGPPLPPSARRVAEGPRPGVQTGPVRPGTQTGPMHQPGPPIPAVGRARTVPGTPAAIKPQGVAAAWPTAGRAVVPMDQAAPPPDVAEASRTGPIPSVELTGDRASPVPRPQISSVSIEDIDAAQLTKVLVSLIEAGRDELHGHSAYAARLAQMLAEQVGLDEGHQRAVVLAALVHDLGKPDIYHLTPLNVSEYEGHRAAAQKLYGAPARLLESAHLPKATFNAVMHMYERFDGAGFPWQLEGEQVPIESGILAIADTYADLTGNPRNPRRKVLGAAEACEELRKWSGKLFAPDLVDQFCLVALRDDLDKQLSTDRATVLVVDPEPQETTMLELTLLENGYHVVTARGLNDALAHVQGSQSIDVIIAESELASGTGMQLLGRVRGLPAGRGITFVFLAHQPDAKKVNEALERGAADYLLKPMAPDIVLAKVKRIVSQVNREAPVSRGISGALDQMSLPDLVQVIAQGRKSGTLSIHGEAGTGHIRFRDGDVWDAEWGDSTGEAAFYGMLEVQKGKFTLDPEAMPDQRVIERKAEMLLLEGLRRLDESNK